MTNPPASPGPLRSKPGLLTVAVIGVVTVGLIVAAQLDSGPTGAEQETLPDFRFEVFDGTAFSLAEHYAEDGRPVVLNFWASWCGPCRAEMPEFDLVAQAHPEVKFIGVAVDDVESNARAFADEIGVSYLLGFDPTGKAHLTLPFVALPTTWIINSDAVIVHKVQGIMTADLLEQTLAEKL